MKNLRIVSYNIAHGREIINYDMKKIAADILAINPDIVGLQEIDRFAKRTNFMDTIKLLSEYTGYPYYHFTKAIHLEGNPAIYGTEGEYGIAILSKYPIREHTSYLLASDVYEQRALEYAKIDIEGMQLHFFNTHLSFEDTKVRCEQFHLINAILADYENCILVGDFNAGEMKEFDLISNLTPTCTHQNPWITFPSEGITIDNIFFSKNMKLINSWVIETGNSDHNILFSDIEINENHTYEKEFSTL